MAEITVINETKKIPVALLCQGLNLARATFYRQKSEEIESSNTSVLKPINALSNAEQQIVLDLLHSERFADSTAYQVYYELLDEGYYICSIRTMYRMLLTQGETKDRRDQRNHRDAIKPELMATAPNEVWSWDITKLLCFERFVYYHLYVIIDIFSRYVVGWMISDRECSQLARELIQKTTLKQGIQAEQLTLHSDNGPSMTSHTVSQLLEHLGILKTHNRPYKSNDNPFSESHFKTLKYCPEFPDRFESMKQAEEFCQKFFNWYNYEHYHSGISWLKPESVHNNKSDEILKNRHQVLLSAYEKNPARFNHKIPKQKILQPVYINPPQNISIGNNNLHKERIMA